jgi:hypothetical protein
MRPTRRRECSMRRRRWRTATMMPRRSLWRPSRSCISVAIPRRRQARPRPCVERLLRHGALFRRAYSRIQRGSLDRHRPRGARLASKPVRPARVYGRSSDGRGSDSGKENQRRGRVLCEGRSGESSFQLAPCPAFCSACVGGPYRQIENRGTPPPRTRAQFPHPTDDGLLGLHAAGAVDDLHRHASSGPARIEASTPPRDIVG